MKLTTREQECITHRLETPDTIWDFIQNADEAAMWGAPAPLTEGGIAAACESLIQKLSATIVIEDLPMKQMWLLMHCITEATWHLGFCAPVGERVLESCAAKVETLLLLKPGRLNVPPKL